MTTLSRAAAVAIVVASYCFGNNSSEAAAESGISESKDRSDVLALQRLRRGLSIPLDWSKGEPCGSGTCGGANAVPCLWEGIQCEAYSITAVILPGRKITGEFSQELFNLRSLRHLDLSNNEVHGNVPWFLFPNFHRLEILNISNNILQGGLPRRQPGLASLRQLDLSNNLFEGKIPNNWASYTAIQSIDVSHNLLSGAIPEELFMSRSLKAVSLEGNCGMCGYLPRSILQSNIRLSIGGTGIGVDAPSNSFTCWQHTSRLCRSHRGNGISIPLKIAIAGLALLIIIAGIVYRRRVVLQRIRNSSNQTQTLLPTDPLRQGKRSNVVPPKWLKTVGVMVVMPDDETCIAIQVGQETRKDDLDPIDGCFEKTNIAGERRMHLEMAESSSWDIPALHSPVLAYHPSSDDDGLSSR